jgi:ligand-binding SRPBCC domain-containing protein
VTNRKFTQALAKALGKPAYFGVPGVVIRATLGEMSELILLSQKVIPEKALALGFRFQHTDLSTAFETLFEREADWYETVQWIPKSLPEVFAFFSEAKNLETLTPPLLQFKIKSVSTPSIQKGTEIDSGLRLHGLPLAWTTRIEEWQPENKFVDIQLKGPYSLWHHTHEFQAMDGGTWMRDRVRYRLPLGSMGRGVAGALVRSDLTQIFDYRRKRIFELFGSDKK